MKNSIALYGDIIIYNIYHVYDVDDPHNRVINYSRTIGGIGGVAKALRGISSFYKINISGSIGSMDSDFVLEFFRQIDCNAALLSHNSGFCHNASTLVSKKLAKKKSFVNWCFRKSNFGYHSADWHHIAYLDNNLHIDIPRIRGGIISADLCKGEYIDSTKKEIFETAKEIDYLFMSDNEANSLFAESSPRNIAKQGTIIHSAYGSECFLKEDSFKIKHDKKEEGYIFGAGDKWAAHFIDAKLRGMDDYDATGHAHERASESV